MVHFLGDSFAESEYRELAALTSEVPWLKSLLLKIEFPIPRTPTLWSNDQSANAIVANPMLHVGVRLGRVR